jgi:5-methylcytosine-specific restriction endonuclease McrA
VAVTAGWNTREARRAWDAATYGPGWDATKDAFWKHPFTWKRCVWCWKDLKQSRRRDLNHITYRRVRAGGWTPLWTLTPMCRRCHKVETWIVKRRRPHMKRRRQAWAHAWVTFGVMFGQWLTLLALIAAGWVWAS